MQRVQASVQQKEFWLPHTWPRRSPRQVQIKFDMQCVPQASFFLLSLSTSCDSLQVYSRLLLAGQWQLSADVGILKKEKSKILKLAFFFLVESVFSFFFS